MYIHDNKMHGSHGFGDQIESLHHFVQGIIGTLPSTNHDGALTQRTLGELMHKAVNDKRNALVHHPVQIGRDPCHLHHHANLKKTEKKVCLSVKVMRRRRMWFKKLTHRQPVIHHTMTMVATISPGGMQPYHRLVPPPIFAQVLGKPCQIAFGQSLELLHHLLTFVHGVETLHPKHNLHLDFQGQHTAKRFVPGVD